MENSEKIEFDKLLELIHQLPDEKFKLLLKTLQEENFSKEQSYDLEKVILQAPVWNESDLNDYKSARKSINKSRLG